MNKICGKVLLILLINILIIKNTSADECIFKECVCYDSTPTTISVSCMSQTGSNKFPERGSPTTIKPIATISFYLYTFTTFPPNAFDGLTIESISVYSTLTTIGRESFVGIKGLATLAMFQKNSFQVESDAFLPIADTLIRFYISECDLNDAKVDLILAELSVCKKLITLWIQSANLVELRPNWLSQFPLLEDVSFSGNLIESLPNGFFDANLNLKKLYLSTNRISNMNTLLGLLSAQKSILEELVLAYNSITSIDDQINTFPNLKTLSLSANLIQNKGLTKQTFQGLLKLEQLSLGANLLVQTIPNDAFMSNLNLKTLDLSRNQLSSVPSLGYLSKLELFMFNNQSEKLTELRDYDFDIITSDRNTMTLHLHLNSLSKFGSRIFCSKSDNTKLLPISDLVLDYKSIESMHLCLFHQLGLRNQNASTNLIVYDPLVGISPNPGNYPTVCSCSKSLFLSRYNIKLDGVCKGFNSTSCTPSGIPPNCAGYIEYDCSKEAQSTTTGSITTRPTAPNSANVVYFPFVSTFILILFSWFCISN